MDLLGLPFLLVLCGLAAALLLAVGWSWSRWPRRLALTARALCLLLVMAMGAVLAGDLLNRSEGFYSGFADLFGTSSLHEPPGSFSVRREEAQLDVLTPGWQASGRRAALNEQGILVLVRFGGRRSGISRMGLVYLPADYFSPLRQARFNVVELFHGTPGGPGNFDGKLHIAHLLDTEIATGRIPPVIAAIPTTYEHQSSECVDAVRGQRNETFLAVDVPADIDARFPVLPGRSFAALGYSTGGFCAVNLALHHPDRYAAAASLSGYFTAGTDPGTSQLYRGSRAALQHNSPLWWVTHRSPSAPPLYLFASAGDHTRPNTLQQEATLAAAVRRHAPRLLINSALLPYGGHTWSTWAAAIPPALDWMAPFLPQALAPPLTLPPAPLALAAR